MEHERIVTHSKEKNSEKDVEDGKEVSSGKVELTKYEPSVDYFLFYCSE